MAQKSLNPPSTSERLADQLVKSITRDHGYLGDDVYAKMDPEVRRQVQEAMLAKDKLIGGSVTVLARELYTKDVRFIFELLQNADDNHFTKAIQAGSQPFVSFHHYHDRIVVECNEDGFNETNVRAICSIGQSSKTGAQGYIGEKGIGFKSIFKVAEKAHIQSGPYSFAFIHRPGDLGMGMISPESVPISERLEDPMTRITLYLHEADNRRQKIDVASQRQSIKEQLQTLQSTMLLFLKKLTKINVQFHEDNGNPFISMTLHRDASNNRTILSRREIRGDQSTETKAYYHVTTQAVIGLSRSDNRNYSDAEESANAFGKAEVILAFPLSDASVPIIPPQEVFAFLPVRRYGFDFIIHSDFVTSANREDIVTSSPRNLELLDGIATAFISAVQEMCKDSTLQYRWLRYLESAMTGKLSPFWQLLIEKIKRKILKVDILRPRRLGDLRRIGDLVCLQNIFLDENGNPLFGDLLRSQEAYLSAGYQDHDIETLRKLGLQEATMDKILARVKQDLSLPGSRIKSSHSSKLWHTRAAKALNYSFDDSHTEYISDTMALALIPLQNGSWVSANDGPIYFPTVSGLPVPDSLGFKLLNAEACLNEERKRLFSILEALNLDEQSVRKEILKSYDQILGPSFSVQTSHDHLVFLYLTHDGNSKAYRNLKIYGDDRTYGTTAADDFYFKSEDPYSLWQLSRTGSVQFLNAHFVHTKYLKESPQQPGRHNLTWKNWLHGLGIRRYPRLISSTGSSLSDECEKVAQCLPKKFLGFLRYSWNSDKAALTRASPVLEEVKNIMVCCQRHEKERSVPLSRTFLPIPSLVTQCSRFLEVDEFFPLLYLDQPLRQESDASWTCLSKQLSVTVKPNWFFYFVLLFHVMTHHTRFRSGRELIRPSRVFELSQRIHLSCYDTNDSRAQQAAVRQVSKHMARSKVIYVPPWKDKEAKWIDPSECVLDAPEDMTHKVPIIARYKAAFSEGKIDFAVSTAFFRETLASKTCSWTHFVDEIKALKVSGCTDFDRVRRQYQCLKQRVQHSVVNEEPNGEIRKSFEDNCLVFVSCREGEILWVKKSDCLWSNATEIRGKFNPKTFYDSDLEDFFVDLLGVDRLNFSIVYDTLLGINPRATPINEVKDLLWSLNSFLMEEERPGETSTRLFKKAILPICYPDGSTHLVTGEVDFGIIDRRAYGEEFRDKIKLLDFDLGEVHKLWPLLKWANLESRYLSLIVKEISVVKPGATYPISNPVWEVKIKAHALTRVATHLRSPRTRDGPQTLYDTFRVAETFETEGISAEHVLSLDGKPFSVQVGTRKVHIEDRQAGLKIYVPCDATSKDVGFLSALPGELVEWMMTDPITNIVTRYDPTAAKTVTSILAVSKDAAKIILDSDGIIEIDVPDLGTEGEHQTRSTPQHGRSLPSGREDRFLTPDTTLAVRTNGIPLPAIISSTLERSRDHDAVSIDGDLSYSSSPQAPHCRKASTPTPSLTIEQLASREYSKLLGYIMHAARRADFPRRGACSAGGYSYQDLSSLNERAMFASSSQLERDLKVGAAGELFTFEFLSSLTPRLMKFSYENWHSTIRGYVAVHPNFTDMKPWFGRETSDIVYSDADGNLTSLLISKGYLSAQEWQTRTPLYYIEVKTTTEGCNTAFYMSKCQYDKMRQYSTDRSIYLIFRVFHLTNSSLGVRVYVNPDQMRRDGELRFEVDKWTVVPG